MPTRRGFLGMLTATAAAGTLASSSASATPAVEPMPTETTCEEVWGCPADVSGHGLAQALSKLGWETGAMPRPILVVHPSNLVYAVSAAQHVGDVVTIVATHTLTDVDTWFVAWRGRRVGSQGALGGDLARESRTPSTRAAKSSASGGLIDLADWFYEQGRSEAAGSAVPRRRRSDQLLHHRERRRAARAADESGLRRAPVLLRRRLGRRREESAYVEEFIDWQVPQGDLKPELGKAVHGALLEDCYILEVSERWKRGRSSRRSTSRSTLHPDGQGPIFEPDAKGEPAAEVPDRRAGEPIRAEKGTTAMPTVPAKAQRTYIKTEAPRAAVRPDLDEGLRVPPGHAKSEKATWGYAYRFYKRVAELREAVDDGIYDAAGQGHARRRERSGIRHDAGAGGRKSRRSTTTPSKRNCFSSR
jgi:hypothetical protein